MTRDRRKFRNIFINPKFQMKYIFWITAAGIALAANNTIIFFDHIQKNYTRLIEVTPANQAVRDLLSYNLSQIAVYLGVGAAIFLVLFILIGFVISHQAAGPLHQFQRVFDEIREGNLDQRIHLRPRDDFQEIAHSFNEMMDTLTQNQRREKSS